MQKKTSESIQNKSKMCEIQFVKRVDGKNLNEKNLKTFIKFMSLGDIGNSDAFGFFNSKKDFKSPGKFDYKKLNSQNIMSDNFVVGHNRFATGKFNYGLKEKEVEIKEIPNDIFYHHGLPPFGGLVCSRICFVEESKKNKKDKKDGKDRKSQQVATKKAEQSPTKEPEKPIPNFNANLNNHPFELNKLVLVHNGVVKNVDSLKDEFKIKTEIVTDSFVILFLIDKFLKESELKEKLKRTKRNRTQLIINAIKKTTDLIEGFYSVFLFDKKEKKLYYFRDDIGSFYFYKPNKNILLGSTSFKNFEYVYKNKEIYQDLIIPKPGKVYLIKDKKGKKNPLQEVGIFREYIKKKKATKKKVRKSSQAKTKEKRPTFWRFLRECLIKLKGGKKKK